MWQEASEGKCGRPGICAEDTVGHCGKTPSFHADFRIGGSQEHRGVPVSATVGDLGHVRGEGLLPVKDKPEARGREQTRERGLTPATQQGWRVCRLFPLMRRVQSLSRSHY